MPAQLPWDLPNQHSPVQFTAGQITREDVAVLERRRDQFASELKRANASVAPIDAKCRKLGRTARSVQRRLVLRSAIRAVCDRIARSLDQTVSRIGGAFIGATLAAATTFLVGFQFGENYLAAFMIAAILCGAFAAAWIFIVKTPTDSVLRQRGERASAELNTVEPARIAVRTILAGQSRLAAAQADVDPPPKC